MATDNIQICNMALSFIRARSNITSLTIGATTGTEERECALHYENARKEALSAYDWSFARQRVLLVEHADAPPDGVWTYRYTLPSDMVIDGAREIENVAGPTADPIPFDIEMNLAGTARTLVTDYGDGVAANAARLIYTKDLSTTTLFSPFFDQTLAHLLASKIAYGISGKSSLVTSETQAYRQYMSQAAALNANAAARGRPKEAEAFTGRG